MAQVQLRNVVKRFDSTEAVARHQSRHADKEFVVLAGSSGCGKPATLRMVFGLTSAFDSTRAMTCSGNRTPCR